MAKQGRPALSFPVPKLQRGLTIASGSTVADLNNVIRRAKKALVQQVEGLARSTDEIVVIVATDETHPVMPRGKWQHGLLVPVASPNILSQKPFLSPTEWSSCSRKRIVRSSAAAEAALAAGGFEHGEFAQAILCEIRDL